MYAARSRAASTLGDALDRHPRLFGGVFVGLVRSGLEVGSLAGALTHVVDYLDRVEQVNRKVTAAALYPAFVLLTFLGVASGMIFGILPQYGRLFASFGKPLPAPTQFLLDFGDFLRNNATVVLGMIVLLALVAILAALDALAAAVLGSLEAADAGARPGLAPGCPVAVRTHAGGAGQQLRADDPCAAAWPRRRRAMPTSPASSCRSPTISRWARA